MEPAHPFYQPKNVKTLTIIIPTLNEVDNVELLITKLEQVLRPTSWSALFVDDDSTDGTYELLRTLAFDRPHIQAIRRIGRRGLSSACIEGMGTADSAYIAVMDADLQHDEHLLRPMLALMESDRLDVVAASRFLRGGSVGPLSARRALMSRTANALSARLCGVRLSDPMSGFFAISRERYELLCDEVNPRGFKILLEFLARGPKPLVSEVGYEFGERINGTTKLNSSVALAYLVALSGLMVQRLRRRVRRLRGTAS